MNSRRSMRFVPVLVLWGGLASAATHTVFFTAPAPERKVFKIEVDVPGATVPNPNVTLLFEGSEGFDPMDIAFGPDGKLYIICASSKICRMDQDGTNLTTFYEYAAPGDPTGLGGMRVLGNDLYFTAAQGIFRKDVFDPSATAELVTEETLAPAAGMTVSLTGDLIASKTTQLFRVARDAGKNFSLEADLSLDGYFASTKGVAAEPVVAISPITSNRKFVTGTRASGGDAVAAFVCDPPPDTTCVRQELLTFALPSGHQARDIEINLGASSFFATDKGRLYRFDGAGAVLLADLSILPLPNKATTGYGVALPPTSRTDTATFGAGETKTINGGNCLVDITTGSGGTATFTFQMALPGTLDAEFSGEAEGARCTQYDWNGGFCTKLTVGEGIGNYELAIAYVKMDEPINAQPLLIHNDSEITITNYWLGDFLAPDDGLREGGGSGSTDVVADMPIEDPATFVGFFPHISTDPDAPSFVNGSQLAVRPRFDHPPLPGEFLRLSVNCGLSLIDVTSVGGANDGNLFRPFGNKWGYNLDLQASGIPLGEVCSLNVWGNVGALVQGFIQRVP